MRSWLLALIAGSTISTTAPAGAETPLWSQLTLEDLRFAHRLIADNHPAAVATFGDAEFRARLADLPRFEAMAGRVRSFGGYRAVLERYAASFGDRHLGRHPMLEPPARWPGFLVARRGEAWQVQNGLPDLPAGSQLLSCDGRAPDAIAETNLAPYTPDWSLRAQRSRASANLFVDRRDPLIERPRSCLFRLVDGSERTVALNWRAIGEEALATALAAARQESAGANALTPFGRGWWLRAGTFQDAVRPTIAQFAATRDRLSGAAFVIVDLRGNTGGSSAYGDMIAAALYGSRALETARRRMTAGGAGGTAWRATAGNLELIDSMVTRFTGQLGVDHSSTRYFIRSAAAMRAAIARSEPFSQAAEDAADTASPVERLAPLARRPRVYVLTDFACFSACLEAVQTLRALGAIQIGEDTDGGLNYFEVRSAVAPSGLSIVSTMQAFPRGQPRRLGPFSPAHHYAGEPGDERQVEAWAARIVGESAAPRRD